MDWSLLKAFVVDEVARLALSLAVVMITPLLLRLVRHSVQRCGSTQEQRRSRTVVMRNTIIAMACIAFVAIWASKIAGFALSVAAVAAAVLIVSKEAITNLVGFIVLVVTKPYQLGDYVEIGPSHGRVVDVNLMTTMLLETREGHQITGATINVPNAQILTNPVRNTSVTGEYVIQLFTVAVPKGAHIAEHESALVRAAEEVCQPWMEDANRHFERLEQDEHLDLPSARPRVLINLSAEKTTQLSLRFACQPRKRVKVEQDILRRYLAQMAGSTEPKPTQG